MWMAAMRKQSRQQLLRAVDQWGDAFPPACRCGCGEPVRFGVNGGLNLYLNTAHDKWDTSTRRRLHAPKYPDLVEHAVFVEMVQRVRVAKGWTVEETAIRGGWSPGRLSGVLYGSRQQRIRLATARPFLRRLGGLAGPMSEWEHEREKDMKKKVQQAIRELRVYEEVG